MQLQTTCMYKFIFTRLCTQTKAYEHYVLGQTRIQSDNIHLHEYIYFGHYLLMIGLFHVCVTKCPYCCFYTDVLTLL